MMAELMIELEARDPARNRFRAWRIEAGRDLFGTWTTQLRFGRIGCQGRVLTRAFDSEAEAQAFIGAGLRRRASAPARIGVPYRCVRATGAADALLRAVNIVTNLRNDGTT
ncbi:WGR domain-containing protein [Limobrevibacterium gyesilva]|uniref:WGR domain-containing protein n=1 Tax=Limobrevibacterium gyesilva TaxID=2991712 RepID=A0AA42CH61_9PROT|nr:WGR domain-containing protein [Limobrevibacterium gyesilva]MCW3476896.1 WGR domain-containing protein [Limobrevibacterium gyesilva]